ncbi:MAG: hypothetical protein K2H46_02570 [Muribaculaceae bacterium]|nr:hypothetical protein [Muribaculaceae bacterium]
MNPIIDPATLTEEQREAIKELYGEFLLQSEADLKFDIIAGCAKRSAFHILFGENFFKKGE